MFACRCSLLQMAPATGQLTATWRSLACGQTAGCVGVHNKFPVHCAGVSNMSPHHTLPPTVKMYHRHWCMGSSSASQQDYLLVLRNSCLCMSAKCSTWPGGEQLSQFWWKLAGSAALGSSSVLAKIGPQDLSLASGKWKPLKQALHIKC